MLLHHLMQVNSLDILHLLLPSDPPPPPTLDPGLGKIQGVADQIRILIQGVSLTVFFIGITVAAMMRILSFGSERRVMFSNIALTSAVVGLAITIFASQLPTIFSNLFR